MEGRTSFENLQAVVYEVLRYIKDSFYEKVRKCRHVSLVCELHHFCELLLFLLSVCFIAHDVYKNKVKGCSLP
jgi:hypothetical protein